jgi:peptidylprolyl isomerase
MRRSLAAIPLAALVLSTTAACGGSGSGDSASKANTDVIDGLTVTGDFGKKPDVKVNGLDVTKEVTGTVIEGDGAEVAADSSVNWFFYVANGTNGKVVASNYADGAPTKLDLAQQPQAIKQAVTGAHIGDRVAVAVPVTDLIGKQGAPQAGLGPKDDVVLVFDLVAEVQPPLGGPKGTAVKPPAAAPKVVEKAGNVTGLDFTSAAKKPPTKLQVIPLINGTGATVKENDQLTVDYYGSVYGKNKPFDESYTKQPATVGLTKGGLIDGWVEGLQGVKVGSRVMLIIPPAQGYGAKGQPPTIPGNATLVFVIDVLGANL